MIKTETIAIGEKEYKKTYSDAGFFIRDESGADYVEAIDVLDKTYVETDVLIDPDAGKEATIEDYKQMLKELGVEL